MDLETIVKRIDELESQLTSVKKSVSNLISRTTEVDEKANSFLENMREQKKEISRISSLVSSLGQFDTALTKVRVDFNRQLEESEKRNQSRAQAIEKIHNEDVKSLYQALESSKKELLSQTEQKIKLYSEENAKLYKLIKETGERIDEKLNADEMFKSSFSLLETEVQQNKKMLDNFLVEFGTFKKSIEGFRVDYDDIINEIRANESHIQEIVITENERKQAFLDFMEQQSLAKNEQERIWKEWESQFNESMNQMYKLIPELQKQQMEMNKTKDTFDEVIQRFERRANELTEMYRLMDEKLKKEWNTFKSDLEKRWSGISLLFEDKQEDLTSQIQKINDRMIKVEDDTHEMQEVLILMSKEIQKGMQGLMNMVNDWMDAFEQLK